MRLNFAAVWPFSHKQTGPKRLYERLAKQLHGESSGSARRSAGAEEEEEKEQQTKWTIEPAEVLTRVTFH